LRFSLAVHKFSHLGRLSKKARKVNTIPRQGQWCLYCFKEKKTNTDKLRRCDGKIAKEEKPMSNQRDQAVQKRAVLEFLSGPHSNASIKLRRDATIFGREKGDIIIDDAEISATHCQIQCIDGHHHIFDMNSTNGTFVNSERIVKAKLNDGDLITIGTTACRFVMREEKEVRHIATIFQSKSDRGGKSNSSIVDTLIESELRSTQTHSIVFDVTYRNGKKEKITLRQRVVYIGRASSFGQFDQNTEISRKHLLVKINDNGEIFIEDQGSTNGTHLNGKRISGMHLVSAKDTVKVGGVTLQISVST